jgi:hypothetical protein
MSWFDTLLLGIAEVQANGTACTRRAKINLIGATIAAVDNPSAQRTDVTFTASITGWVQPTNPGDDYRVAFATGGVLDYAAFVRTDGTTYLAVGTTVAATGDQRVDASYTLVGLNGATDQPLITLAAGVITHGDQTQTQGITSRTATNRYHDWYTGTTRAMWVTNGALYLGISSATTSCIAGNINFPDSGIDLAYRPTTGGGSDYHVLQGTAAGYVTLYGKTLTYKADTSHTFYVNNVVEVAIGTGYLAVGTTVAASGNLRLGAVATIKAVTSGAATAPILETDGGDILHVGDNAWSYVICESLTGHAITLDGVETLTTTAGSLLVGSAVGAFTIGIAAKVGTDGDDLTFQGQNCTVGTGGGFNFIIGKNTAASDIYCGTFRINQGTFGERVSIGEALAFRPENGSDMVVTLDGGSLMVKNDHGETCLECSDLGDGTPGIGFLGAAATTRPTVTGAKSDAVAASILTALTTLGLVTDSPT